MGEAADTSIEATFERLLCNPLQSHEWRDATAWIVTTIRAHLGSDWFKRALDRDDPIRESVLYFPTHRDVFLSILGLAIGLHESAQVGGFVKLRNAIRKDLRQSLLHHTMLTLETAAFARDAGCTVAFEVTEPGYKNPIDLRLDIEGLQIPIEVRVILLDDEFLGQDTAVATVQSAAQRIALGLDVALEIILHEVPSDIDTVITMIDEVARLAQTSRLSIDRQNATIAITAHPTGGAPSSFTGPILGGDTMRRAVGILRQKATKQYGPRPAWLRVELLDGTWALTEWARWPLYDKVLALTERLRGELSDGALAGVVLSSGCQYYAGDIRDKVLVVESAGSFGVRASVPISRARESIIIPFDECYAAEASLLREMARSEQTWLDDAVARNQLASLERMFPPSATP
jgi:hypothetical protein